MPHGDSCQPDQWAGPGYFTEAEGTIMTDNIQGHTKAASAGTGPDATMIGTLHFAKMIDALGQIERAVWSAMMWAADNNPGFDGVPEYTDHGNSFAEVECRRAVARIRAAALALPEIAVLVKALEDIGNCPVGTTTEELIWVADEALAAIETEKEANNV